MTPVFLSMQPRIAAFRPQMIRSIIKMTFVAAAVGTGIFAVAQATNTVVAAPAATQGPQVVLPLTVGWFDGVPALYISTEASDAALAAKMGANFVPALANAINTNPTAIDDIYAVTNFTQGNVIPSAPMPAGPKNTSPQYSPLWQISMVTWNPGIKPHLLRSEQEILAARDAGQVAIVKTNIIVNCPVIYTRFGGLLPGATIIK
jgi:hypothetical protein